MLNGANGTHYRVKLQIFLHFGFLPDTGSIHQIEFKSELIVFGINTVPCGSGNIGHNITVFPNQSIDEG